MERLGIDTDDIGLPGAGPTFVRECCGYAQEIATRSRHSGELRGAHPAPGHHAVIEISQKAASDRSLHVQPIFYDRQYAENWTLEDMLRPPRTR